MTNDTSCTVKNLNGLPLVIIVFINVYSED